MKRNTLVVSACGLVLLAALLAALLATCYHRVVVVEALGGTPLPGAYVTLERSSGAPVELGRTDAAGQLAFWNTPLPLPRIICAQSTFYPQACVNAISLQRRTIALAVPDLAP